MLFDVYNEISWDEFYVGCEALRLEHFEEIKVNGLYDYLDIDEEKYASLDKAGKLKILVVKNKDKIIGYCVAIILNESHQKHKKIAVIDTHYIKPCTFRGWKYAKLYRETIKVLEKEQVDKIYTQENIQQRSMFKLFCRLDFVPVSVVYCKILRT